VAEIAHLHKFFCFRYHVACVAGGSGYPRELRSRTRVQKAAQVARRMRRSLVEVVCSRLRRSRKFPRGRSPSRELRRKKFRACTHSRQLRRLATMNKILFLSNKQNFKPFQTILLPRLAPPCLRQGNNIFGNCVSSCITSYLIKLTSLIEDSFMLLLLPSFFFLTTR